MHFISYTNGGYVDFARNIIANFEDVLVRHGHRMIMVCIDGIAYDALTSSVDEPPRPWLDVVMHRNDSPSSSCLEKFENFGTPVFNKLMHVKIDIVKKHLADHDELYYVDCDVVFFRDPYPTIRATAGDVLFQQDQPVSYHNMIYHTYVCCGNFVVRKNPATIAFLEKWTSMCAANPHRNDQEVLYDHFQACTGNDVRGVSEIAVGILPVEEFQNGYDAFQAGWKDKPERVCIHANHMSGADAKRNALGSVDRWYV
jgi:hypothetical protein